MLNIKKSCRVRDHCHYTDEFRYAAHSICNLKYIVAKEMTVVFFYNRSNYDYNFMIKEIVFIYENT